MEFHSYEEMLESATKNLKRVEKEEGRFKIPEVDCMVEGRKTLFRNFMEFVEVFRRDKKHLAKFLSRELASPSFFQGNILVFQSVISKEKIKKKIEDYLKTFVYCRECKSPDTKLVKEKRFYYIKCEACGAKTYVKKI